MDVFHNDDNLLIPCKNSLNSKFQIQCKPPVNFKGILPPYFSTLFSGKTRSLNSEIHILLMMANTLTSV